MQSRVFSNRRRGDLKLHTMWHCPDRRVEECDQTTDGNQRPQQSPGPQVAFIRFSSLQLFVKTQDQGDAEFHLVPGDFPKRIELEASNETLEGLHRIAEKTGRSAAEVATEIISKQLSGWIPSQCILVSPKCIAIEYRFHGSYGRFIFG